MKNACLRFYFYVRPYSGLLGWAIGFALIFLKAHAPIIRDFTHVTGGDTLWWYGIFHYFFESISAGHVPLWNPYANGGSPFYFFYGMFRLSDPTILFPLLAMKLGQTNLFKLYYQYALLREYLYILGVGLVVHTLFRSQRLVLLLGLLFVVISDLQMFSMFKRDVVGWTPWIVLCAIYAYRNRSQLALFLTAYFAGVQFGSGSYHSLYLGVTAVIFTTLFSIWQRKEFWDFVWKNRKSLVLALLLFTGLSLPMLSCWANRGDFFPVARVYGARDTMINHYQKTKTMDVKPSYDEVYLIPSMFIGNYLRWSQFKNLFLNPLCRTQVYVLLFLAVFLLLVRVPAKWPLILTIVALFYFSLAKAPGYRFLYDHIPPFGMIRHTAGFLHVYELLQVVMVGYAIQFLAFGSSGTRWTKWKILAWIGIAGGALFLYPNFRPESPRFILFILTMICLRGEWRSWIAFACLGWIFYQDAFPHVYERYRIGFMDKNSAIRKPNDIYADLDQNNFKANKIEWDPIRKFALPRPAYLLYEDLLLKKNITVNSVLETPASTAQPQPFTYGDLWPSYCISNRVTYWPDRYVDTYLMGEENLPAFIDIMGVDRHALAFYPQSRVLPVSHAQQLQLFSQFPYGKNMPLGKQDPDKALKLPRLTDHFLFIDGNKNWEANEIIEMLQKNDLNPIEARPSFFKKEYFDSNQLKITTDTTEPGYLLFRDTYSPHWKATIDGKSVEIVPANINFKAIPLPAGRHTVEFKYFPISFAFGLMTYFWMNLLAMVMVAFHLRKKMKRRPKCYSWEVKTIEPNPITV